MTDHESKIQVEIYDRVYHLQSSVEDSYTRRLAQTVDSTMRTIADQTQTIDTLRVAVLTALHYADRYERLRERYEKLNGAVTEKTARIQRVLEAANF